MPSWEHDGRTFNPLHRPWAPQCTDRQIRDSIIPITDHTACSSTIV